MSWLQRITSAAHSATRTFNRVHARMRARKRLAGPLSLWYHPQMVPPTLAATSRVPDLDLGRCQRILGQLASEGLIEADDISAVPSATVADFLRVHSPAYLDSMTQPGPLAEVFALEGHEISVDEIWRAQRRAVGATMAASRWAATTSGRQAIVLGGGFHHAHPEKGAGFCVFNDIAIAIAGLRDGGFTKPIAIIDLDFHQGDGNMVSFSDDETVLTYSLHGSVWSHIEAEANFGLELPPGTGDDEYLRALRSTLPRQLDAHAAELAFYIAGTDVLAGDALGSFELSREGAWTRDSFVMGELAARRASTVVVLGGGYSRDAWRSTYSLVRAALCDDPGLDRASDRQHEIRQRFERIARSLDSTALGGGDNSLELDESELWGHITGTEKPTKLLGYYTAAGVELALERYGLLDRLRKRGFRDLEVAIDYSDADAQRVSITCEERGTKLVLVELVLARRHVLDPLGISTQPFEMLSVEWLLLQDPTREFSLRRPPLPGQMHPSLGMLRETMEMLRQSCIRLDLDGLVVHPAHYHTAVYGTEYLRFLDPRLQGTFEAMQKAVAGVELATASARIDAGALVDAQGEVVPWCPEDFAHAVSDRLTAYFTSKEYDSLRQKAASRSLHLRRA